jgi:succinate-semialdehyde dehydrogenase/glutarate-semialdehyde dehydrogenase
MNHYRLYVDGQWVEALSGERIDIVNPANGEVVASAAKGDERDARRAADAAHRAFRSWAATPAPQRAEVLLRIYDGMLTHAEELARAVTMEMGKPIREARAEVKLAAEYVRWNAEEAKRIYGSTIPAPLPHKRLHTLRQPVGPAAAITPWNFPISMVTRKLAPALAAGCTVVFKPASQTPGAAVLFFRIAEEAGLPPGAANLVTGSAAKIAGEWVTDARIRKITFTGSTDIGKQLARLAADQVKRVSLELGGHAPYIVFDDADVDLAVEGAVASKFRNNGQTCICANRIYVQRGIHEAFLKKFKARVESLRIGDGMEESTDLGPLVDRAALAKVEEHVRDAVSKGGALVTGGRRLDEHAHAQGCFYAPTIIDQANESMLISSEETFGPVAPVYVFETEEEVIRRANDTPFGLAAYVFTNDLSRAVRVPEALEYGMVGVNDPVMTTVQGPFGGMKESGIGREGGPDGLSDFLETKFISTALRV